jgi:hypothetical protein
MRDTVGEEGDVEWNQGVAHRERRPDSLVHDEQHPVEFTEVGDVHEAPLSEP